MADTKKSGFKQSSLATHRAEIKLRQKWQKEVAHLEATSRPSEDWLVDGILLEDARSPYLLKSVLGLSLAVSDEDLEDGGALL